VSLAHQLNTLGVEQDLAGFLFFLGKQTEILDNQSLLQTFRSLAQTISGK
jgi:hypothetical protein